MFTPFFFDPSTPPMRKEDDRGNKKVKKKKEKTDENSCHYVIASSRLPERRPLERCTLAPIMTFIVATNVVASRMLTGTPTARANK